MKAASVVAAVAALAAASATTTPVAPTLPEGWTAAFVGAWLNDDGSGTNCTGSGYQYYALPSLNLRTDWTFGPGCSFVSDPVTPPGVLTVQDAQHGVLRHYHMRTNTSAIVCEAFPTAGWLPTNFLSNATWVGATSITTAWGAVVPANAWNVTGLYEAGYVLVYTPAAGAPAGSPIILRQTVLQGVGFDSYQQDYLSLTATDAAALPAGTFNPYPAVGCMPM